jgi:hypothetical protein
MKGKGKVHTSATSIRIAATHNHQTGDLVCLRADLGMVVKQTFLSLPPDFLSFKYQKDCKALPVIGHGSP